MQKFVVAGLLALLAVTSFYWMWLFLMLFPLGLMGMTIAVACYGITRSLDAEVTSAPQEALNGFKHGVSGNLRWYHMEHGDSQHLCSYILYGTEGGPIRLSYSEISGEGYSHIEKLAEHAKSFDKTQLEVGQMILFYKDKKSIAS